MTFACIVRLPSRARALDIDGEWHRCYHGTKPDSIEEILKVGHLVAAGKRIILFLFFSQYVLLLSIENSGSVIFLLSG